MYPDLRLAKCYHPQYLGWCKIFQVWVILVTEHTFFFVVNSICCYNLAFLLLKVLGNEGNNTFKVFCELIVIHKYISMILSVFFLLCCLRCFVQNLVLQKIMHFLGKNCLALNLDGVKKMTFCKSASPLQIVCPAQYTLAFWHLPGN